VCVRCLAFGTAYRIAIGSALYALYLLALTAVLGTPAADGDHHSYEGVGFLRLPFELFVVIATGMYMLDEVREYKLRACAVRVSCV